VKCDVCHQPLEIGDFPFCPHGRGHAPAVVQDTIEGGRYFENGFDRPTLFYSHSEHRKALEARGYEIVAKHAGEHDKHLTNWAASVDAKTLENAAVLVSRGKISTPDQEEMPYPIYSGVVKGRIPEGFTRG
jgi:hypothetical protein